METKRLKEYFLNKYPKTKINLTGKRCANFISLEQILFDIDQFEKECASAEPVNDESALPIPDVSEQLPIDETFIKLVCGTCGHFPCMCHTPLGNFR